MHKTIVDHDCKDNVTAKQANERQHEPASETLVVHGPVCPTTALSECLVALGKGQLTATVDWRLRPPGVNAVVVSLFLFWPSPLTPHSFGLKSANAINDSFSIFITLCYSIPIQKAKSFAKCLSHVPVNKRLEFFY